jgi:hypothetical protein
MNESNTSALNEMLKRVHDKKKYVIPNLFRNLEFRNENELIAFVFALLRRFVYATPYARCSFLIIKEKAEPDLRSVLSIRLKGPPLHSGR